MKLPRTLFAVAVLAGACSKTPEPPPSVEAPPSATPEGGKVKPRKPGDKHQPMAADAVPLTLDVAVGSDVTTWKKDAFDKVARYTLGSDGDARDVWSMREVAATFGPTAHVVSVTGEGGTKAMDAAAWADPKQTPILHTTRRGTLKFTWADDKGVWGETAVKDVTRIDIAK